MGTKLKFALVSAIFLLPFAYPHSALSRIWSLSYQEAVWMCGTGDLQACECEMARSGMSGNSQVSGGNSTIPQDRTISASPDNEDSVALPPPPK